MSKKLSVTSMLMLLVAAALLVVSIFLPWWGMEFFAPQYPEGLNIIVYPYKMEGEITIINGLNHYIGMAPFSEESFPELTYLPYIIGFMAILIVVVALMRNKKVLYGLVGLFMVGGAVGIYDIHRWLKSYGTNLSPQAPIDVDPFVPPIIGENTLANFLTNSYFTYGSFLLGIVFILLIIPIWKDRTQ